VLQHKHRCRSPRDCAGTDTGADRHQPHHWSGLDQQRKETSHRIGFFDGSLFAMRWSFRAYSLLWVRLSVFSRTTAQDSFSSTWHRQAVQKRF